ncbi:MAG: sugar transferase [Clostridia bacterium]
MEKNNLALAEEITTSIPEKVERQKAKVFNIQSEIKKENKVEKAIYIGIKRTIDVIGSLVGMVLLVPATIAIYIARKVLKEDDGPIFYTQLRIGKNGKQFKLYKFRSMCMNADEKLKEYLKSNEKARKEFEENQKLQHDPRITKLGNFLRKTSLDELPQMLNILKGEMSFVGPRPVVKREIEKYGESKEKLLSVKPGLTGYWQVNGRSNTTYEERMNMELYYVDNCSLWLDIKIFFKTFIAVFKKEGAI